MPTVVRIIDPFNYVYSTLSNATTGLNSVASTVGTANSITSHSIRSDHFFKGDRSTVQQFPCCFIKDADSVGSPQTNSQFLHTYAIEVEVFDVDTDQDTLNLRLMVWDQSIQQLLNDLTATNMWNNTIIQMAEDGVSIDYDPNFIASNGNAFLRHVVVRYSVVSVYGSFIS